MIIPQSSTRGNTPSLPDSDAELLALCRRALVRDRLDAQRRQASYVQQVAQQAFAWWTFVLSQYRERQQEVLCMAGGAHERGDDREYATYTNRARRWNRIIHRLDNRDTRWLLTRYERIRSRPEVKAVVFPVDRRRA